jgi:large subunit ribosomal protein L35|uniref:Large ribosomal subunit protein bL35 n=1 Tax=candidate division WOR-3 bacterium TaxID=2052148 RepID=A0A7C3UYL4_UNCW3
MKLKTLKSLKKRVKITATGKLMHHRAGKRHLLSGKGKRRKRRLSRPTVVKKSEAKRLKKVLPYL